MTIENRFRIHRSGDIVHLHGVLTDTTNFRVIDEMLSGCRYFDCSQILNASWNGLVNFNRYLKNLDQRITLTNVPNHIFNYLRLMPDVNDGYGIEQVELDVIDLDAPEPTTKNVFVSTEKLKLLADECTRTFINLSHHEAIFGRNSFVCPAKFGDRTVNAELGHSSWYKENQEEFDYWYDYCNFANVTSFLALDLVESLTSTLAIILKEIELNVRQSENALGMLSGEDRGHTADQIDAIIAYIRESCNELARVLQSSSMEGKSLLLKVQLLADADGDDQQEKLYAMVDSFAKVTVSMAAVLPKIEDVGANTGERISALGVSVALKQALAQIDDDAVSSELLEQVREELEIMDPLSEDSWPDTKEEFIAQIETIDRAISETVILVQGFDLLRQILEHRLAEAEQILAYTKDPSQNFWASVRDEVYKLVGKTLVTDQEKYSCEFFIPEAAEHQEKKQAPGDVLLF